MLEWYQIGAQFLTDLIYAQVKTKTSDLSGIACFTIISAIFSALAARNDAASSFKLFRKQC